MGIGILGVWDERKIRDIILGRNGCGRIKINKDRELTIKNRWTRIEVKGRDFRGGTLE